MPPLPEEIQVLWATSSEEEEEEAGRDKRKREGRRKERQEEIYAPAISRVKLAKFFGEIGGELPAKFGRRFSSFFCWGKSSEAFSTKTPPQISPSNFTTRFWVVAGPRNLKRKRKEAKKEIEEIKRCH